MLDGAVVEGVEVAGGAVVGDDGVVAGVGVGVEVEEPGDEEEGGQHGDEREGDSARRVGGLLEREQRRGGKGI